MKTWTLRLGLSLTVVVAFWAKPSAAQEVLVVPTVPYEPAHQGLMPPAFAQRVPPPPPARFHARLFNSHGMGCQVNPYYPLCGNLGYELNFAFSSCRWFFDEACPPNAPCANRPWLR